MIVYCQMCEKPMREGQEVMGTFKAYFHELRSKVHYAITKPHDYVPNTLMHADCNQEAD